MFGIIKQRSTHSGQLERWKGSAHLESVSAAMKDWYGPDIPMAGVPGNVYARKGGDFVGRIDGGKFASYLDYERERVRRIWRVFALEQSRTLNAGIASFADYQACRQDPQRRQRISLRKTALGARSAWQDLWSQAGTPGAGGAPAAAPGGTALNASSTGAALTRRVPASGDTQHAVQMDTLQENGSRRAVVLIDRLYHVQKAMNSTTAEAVTGVPTRYQSTTPTDDEYAGGNILYPHTRTVLPATAHNHVTLTYTNQDGVGQTLPSAAGNNSNAAGTIDLGQSCWFMPLAAGDTGVQTITQIQTDAAIATGQIDFVISRPLAWGSAMFDQPFAVWIADGVNSSFNFQRILDDACLTLMACPISGAGSGDITFQSAELVNG